MLTQLKLSRAHNSDAKAQNATVNDTANLLPLHDKNTNEPIAGSRNLSATSASWEVTSSLDQSWYVDFALGNSEVPVNISWFSSQASKPGEL
jgi:hypothetical protein